ncbi:MAG: AAA family ATPase [Thermodesulfobacteriota bacterium]|nr:AAA family ATPase [Thermodesulfobacteriota bacterium]
MNDEFRLPTYEELSKEQDRVLRRTQLEGRYLVYGAPGTGKTVIALLLADKLKRNNKDCLCLVYNRVLARMSLALANNIDIKTWHSWFLNFFQQQYERPPPEIKKYEYDWNEIEKIFYEQDSEIDSNITILIDEGQDMPPEFYDFMYGHFQNIFVSADENQQLFDTNSTIKDIKDRLEIEKDKLFSLSKNYRNTRQIAQLAERFYCGTAAESPELPEENGEIPLLIEFKDNDFVINRIIQRHKNYPDNLIGIIAPNNKVREHYYKQLQSKGIESLYTYANKLGYKNQPIQFNRGGIVVINFQSAKGLEFDEVFIADLNEYIIHEQGDERFRKEMYVLTSRAKERLFLLIDANKPGYKREKILHEFPDDTDILRKWQQNG